MDELLKAISVCGTEAELARRLTAYLGREIRTGHIYYWKKRGFSLSNRDDVIPAIEAVTAGESRCERLCPTVEWLRDADGNPTSYVTPLPPPPQSEQAQV